MNRPAKSPPKRGSKTNPNSSKKKNSAGRGGFTYTVSWEQIQKYQTWSYERRLQWLMIGNRLRKSLPSKIIKLQEAFRQGRI